MVAHNNEQNEQNNRRWRQQPTERKLSDVDDGYQPTPEKGAATPG